MAYQHFHRQEYLEGVKHGLDFLRNVHRDPASGGYAWVLRFLGGKAEIEDATSHCYGLAFVLLAYSYALCAGFRYSNSHRTRGAVNPEKVRRVFYGPDPQR
jgi:mannose/cellobiose epimerase-like protein (N-acyl-D-glucosamine 2-epimerase family)